MNINKILELISELDELNNCRPEKPYRKCNDQSYSNLDHYDCHSDDRRRVIEELKKEVS